MKAARVLIVVALLMVVANTAFADARQRHRQPAVHMILVLGPVSDGGITLLNDSIGITPLGLYEENAILTTDRPVTLSTRTGRQEVGTSFVVKMRDSFILKPDPLDPATSVQVKSEAGILAPASMDLTWFYRKSAAVGFKVAEFEPYDGGPPWYGKLHLFPIDAEGRFAPFGGDWSHPQEPVIRYSVGTGSPVLAHTVDYTSEGLGVWLNNPDGCPSEIKVDAQWGANPVQSLSVPIDCTKSPSDLPQEVGSWNPPLIGILCALVAAVPLLVVWRKRRK